MASAQKIWCHIGKGKCCRGIGSADKLKCRKAEKIISNNLLGKFQASDAQYEDMMFGDKINRMKHNKKKTHSW